MFTDIVQTVLIDENKIGPKVYSLFPNGRLEEFIDAPNLNQNDYFDPKTSRSIAMIMVEFHLLKMSFNKEPRWLFRIIEK